MILPLLLLNIYFVISMQAREITLFSRTIGQLSKVPNCSSVFQLLPDSNLLYWGSSFIYLFVYTSILGWVRGHFQLVKAVVLHHSHLSWYSECYLHITSTLLWRKCTYCYCKNSAKLNSENYFHHSLMTAPSNYCIAPISRTIINLINWIFSPFRWDFTSVLPSSRLW